MINKKLLAYFENYLTEKRKTTFKKVLNNRTRHFTLVLEDIYQPHNSSAVFRTCDIFGIQDVHVIENGGPLKLGDISPTNKESPASSSLAIAKELQFGHLISILDGRLL